MVLGILGMAGLGGLPLALSIVATAAVAGLVAAWSPRLVRRLRRRDVVSPDLVLERILDETTRLGAFRRLPELQQRIADATVEILGLPRAVVEALAWVANAIEENLIDPIISFIVRVGRAIAEFMGSVMGDHLQGSQGPQMQDDPSMTRMLEQIEANEPMGRQGFGLGGSLSAPEASLATPNARPQTVNNFHRGSVTVRQEFRQADPDRVMVRMVNDIDAQAERRTQSGFAPALTR